MSRRRRIHRVDGARDEAGPWRASASVKQRSRRERPRAVRACPRFAEPCVRQRRVLDKRHARVERGAIRRTTSPVPSVDRSSTTMTSRLRYARRGSNCTHDSILRRSSRAGTITETSGASAGTLGGSHAKVTRTANAPDRRESGRESTATRRAPRARDHSRRSWPRSGRCGCCLRGRARRPVRTRTAAVARARRPSTTAPTMSPVTLRQCGTCR